MLTTMKNNKRCSQIWGFVRWLNCWKQAKLVVTVCSAGTARCNT